MVAHIRCMALSVSPSAWLCSISCSTKLSKSNPTSSPIETRTCEDPSWLSDSSRGPAADACVARMRRNSAAWVLHPPTQQSTNQSAEHNQRPRSHRCSMLQRQLGCCPHPPTQQPAICQCALRIAQRAVSAPGHTNAVRYSCKCARENKRLLWTTLCGFGSFTHPAISNQQGAQSATHPCALQYWPLKAMDSRTVHLPQGRG